MFQHQLLGFNPKYNDSISTISPDFSFFKGGNLNRDKYPLIAASKPPISTSDELFEYNHTLYHCANCIKVAKFNCGQCKASWYCSKKCQKQHWSRHQIFCEQEKLWCVTSEYDPNHGTHFLVTLYKTIHFVSTSKELAISWISENRNMKKDFLLELFSLVKSRTRSPIKGTKLYYNSTRLSFEERLYWKPPSSSGIIPEIIIED
jgi:hypothetical protein